jgi:hypothetical protein
MFGGIQVSENWRQRCNKELMQVCGDLDIEKAPDLRQWIVPQPYALVDFYVTRSRVLLYTYIYIYIYTYTLYTVIIIIYTIVNNNFNNN